jgi:Kef-type K+ transport system membrane component KefB
LTKLLHTELIVLLSGLGIMLILSRVFAEAARYFKLPIVMGEILLGILLGPTVLGFLSPNISSNLFPDSGGARVALSGVIFLSAVMLLFVAGMEVQLKVVIKQGKLAIYTGILSMIFPFVLGFAAIYYFSDLLGIEHVGSLLPYALFFGTALAISALPVIARILMDMNMFKTKIGMVIIASAMFNDLFGWLMFSFILSLIKIDVNHTDSNILLTILYIFAFGGLMLTIGKRAINKILPWVQTKLSWPGGVLSLSLGLCFLCAAFTEYIGLHAILGAFILGIAIGDSEHLDKKANEIIHQFITNIFAPLFFVSIGLRVNFITNFDITLVVIVTVLAFVGKMVGATIGARLGGMSKNEALAVASGLNARGAMEIILSRLALNAKLINEKMFVALVIMALVTSLASGPMIKRFAAIRPAKTKRKIS